MFTVDTYDVIVIGAGHAGCEAALASARLGAKTLMATLNLDNIALMPCNPAVGGPGKSHLVREIDALGGEMGINTDKTCLQMRMLNTGKGPAVYSLRAQSDKKLYQMSMTKTLENQDNLDVKQLMITDLLLEDGVVSEVVASGIGEALAAIGAHDGGADMALRRVEDVAARVGAHRELGRPAVFVDGQQLVAVQQLAARDAVGVDQDQFNQAHIGVLGEEVVGFLDVGKFHRGVLGRMG